MARHQRCRPRLLTLLDPLPNGQRDHVRAEVSGCAAGAAEREVEPAIDLPPLTVAGPGGGGRSVHVSDLLPGCLLDVLVNGLWAGGGWAGGREVRVGVAEALRKGQQVVVTARLCDQQRSAEPVTVVGPLELHWERPTDGGLAV